MRRPPTPSPSSSPDCQRPGTSWPTSAVAIREDAWPGWTVQAPPAQPARQLHPHPPPRQGVGHQGDRRAGRRAWNRLRPEAEQVGLEPELVHAPRRPALRPGRAGGRGGAWPGGTRPSTPPGDGRDAYLQLVMRRLWDTEQARGSRRLRLATLQDAWVAPPTSSAPIWTTRCAAWPRPSGIAAGAFQYLVTPSGTKFAHLLPDLSGFTGTSEEALAPVLEKLAAPASPPGAAGPPRATSLLRSSTTSSPCPRLAHPATCRPTSGPGPARSWNASSGSSRPRPTASASSAGAGAAGPASASAARRHQPAAQRRSGAVGAHRRGGHPAERTLAKDALRQSLLESGSGRC